MIREITKEIVEKFTVCDICNEISNSVCVVCKKDICDAHKIYIDGIIICFLCSKKEFIVIYDIIKQYLYQCVYVYPNTYIYPYTATGTVFFK